MEHGSESFHVVEQLLPIALILISAKIAGVLSLRIGMPAVFGELLVGLLLGPAVLGWVLPSETIAVMAEIGVVLLMFMAGMETDTVAMRAVGKPAFLAAAGGVVLPLVGGSLAMLAFPEITWAQGVLIGAVLMATSV
ncbi:MAG: cation:proton antiporter, partial [Roseiflexaceae bacterium]